MICRRHELLCALPLLTLAWLTGCATTAGSEPAVPATTEPLARVAPRQEEDSGGQDEDLAGAARDPTAPITAFQIRLDYVSDFHNLDDADQASIVLQPIIPYKLFGQPHIARITLPYVVNSPDWGALSLGSSTGIPPNYVPTEEQEGLGDTALVDLFIYDAPWTGRWGFGAAAVLPTASDPALGGEKWSVGPAIVGIAKAGALQYGTLAQWLFSVAGESDRDDVSVLALQPFASYGLPHGWSVGTSEIVYNYNFEAGMWTSVPLGGRVEKLIQLGSLPARVYVDLEYNFRDTDVVPAWTWRLAFVPLF